MMKKNVLMTTSKDNNTIKKKQDLKENSSIKMHNIIKNRNPKGNNFNNQSNKEMSPVQQMIQD